MEQDTQTSIVFPGQNSGEEHVRISGQTPAAVDSCRTRIEVVVENAIRKYVLLEEREEDLESHLQSRRLTNKHTLQERANTLSVHSPA